LVEEEEVQNLEKMYDEFNKLQSEGKIPAAIAKAATADETAGKLQATGRSDRGRNGGVYTQATGQSPGRLLEESGSRRKRLTTKVLRDAAPFSFVFDPASRIMAR
jgi:hypothetical protein